ncbi:MAG: HdeD family acid-resistance protein [Thiothrix sp.]|nr:MAG: HdeD family acid-resistance protein [Thiothrix sp.]
MSTLLSSTLAEANSQIARVTSNWYWFILAGIVFLIGGFIAIAKPVIASFTIESMIAFFFIAGGILQAIQSFSSNRNSSFIWSLFFGILYIALGIVLLKNPVAGLFSLTLVVVSLLAASGLIKIIYSIKLRPLSGWIWMLISGLISLVLAFLLISNLAASAAITLALLLAVEMISTGLWLILIGFSFRRAYNEIRA